MTIMKDECSKSSLTRQQWIKVLALGSADELSELWKKLDIDYNYQVISEPETGLITARAKMGGGGGKFNLGDVTVTRCIVKLASGQVGLATQIGTDHKKSLYSALADALMQSGFRRAIEQQIIQPLAASYREQTEHRQREVQSSRVDFYTMVRGE